MRNSKLEWCTDTWNAVAGCLHGCDYCYAAGIARRFGGHKGLEYYMAQDKPSETGGIHVLEEPMRNALTQEIEPYPFGFGPTFFRYRLDEYRYTTPSNIFVTSMGDLFGKRVPDDWLREVFDAMLRAPQHNYLFLTKNPARYNRLPVAASSLPPNVFFGATATTAAELDKVMAAANCKLDFLSIEPIHGFIGMETFLREHPNYLKWVIVGAENGKRQGKVAAEKDWIEDVVSGCASNGIPLFMKHGYAGTIDNNQSVLSRLSIKVDLPHPTEDQMVERVFSHVPQLGITGIRVIVQACAEIRDKCPMEIERGSVGTREAMLSAGEMLFMAELKG